MATVYTRDLAEISDAIDAIKQQQAELERKAKLEKLRIRKRTKKISGYILEHTVSPIDGAPVVIIATMKSGNAKTGNMVQVWILRSDIAPTDAVKNGCDASVCGDCPHRANGIVKDRTCYVTVFQAPLSVFKAYKKGNYTVWNGDASVFSGRKVRWGAYGDPALISGDIVRNISAVSDGWTGYTHQWKQPFAKGFEEYLQASCDSVSDLETANADGWGSFTVLPVGMAKSELPFRTVRCPASVNDTVRCIDCGLCNGAKAKHVVIEAHGRKADAVQWA